MRSEQKELYRTQRIMLNDYRIGPADCLLSLILFKTITKLTYDFHQMEEYDILYWFAVRKSYCITTVGSIYYVRIFKMKCSSNNARCLLKSQQYFNVILYVGICFHLFEVDHLKWIDFIAYTCKIYLKLFENMV